LRKFAAFALDVRVSPKLIEKEWHKWLAAAKQVIFLSGNIDISSRYNLVSGARKRQTPLKRGVCGKV
jgi:hypothetical protein